jgi:nucleotide-binding universal stress UspA family protein
MTIKTILVCVSSAEASRATLQAACLLARNFDTHIEALHVRADPRSLVPYTGEGMDGSMIEEIMDVTEREGGQRAEAARQMFDELCREHSLNVADAPSAAPGPSISWREETGREDEVIAVRGRLYDAVVVGRAVRNSALPSLITLEAALLDTGRPILVTPPNPPSAVGRSVAVAWESSPEAARAISFALPILAAADTVTILAPDPVEPPSIPVDELVSRLAWSGIEADVRSFDTKEVEIGAGFLRAAGEAGADLLVKGAYARSRVRQMVLGGRTRHIITHTGIPVLLSH